MYVYIYIYLLTHKITQTHMKMCAYIHTYIHICEKIYYLYTHTNKCIHVYINIYMHI